MAKGDNTPNPGVSSQPPQYGNMYGGPGGGYNGVMSNFGQASGTGGGYGNFNNNLPRMGMGGTMSSNTGSSKGSQGALNNVGQGGGQLAGQLQGQNPLFQGMDPRLVSLFQQYNVNPTGRGTGNSDIAYWNDKINAPGADANYFLGRLGSDFGGNGPDLANNNLSYGGNTNNLAQRYYQQPMMRRFGPQGPMRRFGFGGQYTPPSGITGNYPLNGSNMWGYQIPQYNYTTVQNPTPKPDTSENPNG